MSAPHIGTKVAIATGLPATFNEAGYEALTWVDISGIVSVSETGDEGAAIDVPNLTTGRTKTSKGATKGQPINIAYADVASDAGQAAVIAASKTTAEYSLRISEPGASGAPERYFSGPVMNFRRRERSTTSYAGASFAVADNYGEVSGT
jgi:hypothetical protein